MGTIGRCSVMATYEREPKRGADRKMRDESRDRARRNKAAVAMIGQLALDRRVTRVTGRAGMVGIVPARSAR